MAFAIYTVGRTSRGWVIRHAGDASQAYETVGAAFEAACKAVSVDLERGLDATITIDHARRADDEFGHRASREAYVRSKGEPIPWG